MKKVIYTLLAIILLSSCTNHKSIYKSRWVNYNEVNDYLNPQGQIEATPLGEYVYYCSPIIGATIGYYQNIIKFNPNNNRINQLTGAIIGGLPGTLTCFIYNKI